VIEISVVPEVVEAGEAAQARVRWTPLGGGDPARSLLITVGWHTEGRGDRDALTIEECVIRAGSAVAGKPLQGACDFVVPANGPVSYDGRLLRVLWEVAARVDVRGARDEVERAPFRVVARGSRHDGG